MIGRVLAVCCASALATATGGARAQHGEGDAAGGAAAPGDDDRVEALARVVRDRVVDAAGQIGGDAVVAVNVTLAEGAPDPEGLAHRLARPMAAAMRGDDRLGAVDTWIQPGGEHEAIGRRAAMRDYDVLVAITAEARGSFLHVRADVVRAARGRGLLDLFAPEPERVSGIELRRRLDAHLRRYAGALPRVTDANVVARPMPLPSRGYLAMTASDLDGDGRTELVLATSDRVDVVRLGATRRGTPRAHAVGDVAITGLPAPPARTRRPIGTAIAGERTAIVRVSHHGAPFAVSLADRAVTVARVTGPCLDDAFPVDDACAVPVTGRDYFNPALTPRAGGAPPVAAPSGFYARAARELPAPDGSVTRVEAVVTPRGRLAVRVGDRAGGAVGYGAALGMTDLEDDGLADLLLSSSAAIGGGDRLALLRVRADGGVIAVWASEPIEGSVLVAGNADLDDDGRDELLAIEEPPPGSSTPARLWIVR